MTDRTLIQDMVEQIKFELDSALEQTGKANDVALDHIQRVTKQVDSLRYYIWNTFHVSGTAPTK